MSSMDKKKTAIFTKLCDGIDKSTYMLEEGFKLEPENENQKIFALGAMDGIALYHTRFEDKSDSEGMKQLIQAIECNNEGNREEAFNLVEEFANECQMVFFEDLILSYIYENRAHLDIKKLREFAVELIMDSSKREAVKFGIAIHELLNFEGIPEYDRMFQMLGACDEFALFVCHVYDNRSNRNELLWDIAKRTKGWGRIHSIRCMKDISEEIADWLILNGLDNEVMPEYSALDVFEKANCGAFIKNAKMDYEHFRKMIELMKSLINEGPVPGISELENVEEVAVDFIHLMNARSSELQCEDFEIVDYFFSFAAGDSEIKKELLEAVDELVNTTEIKNLIAKEDMNEKQFGFITLVK